MIKQATSDAIKICKSMLDNIYWHALETYPDECCGFVSSEEVRRCKNIQGEIARLSCSSKIRTSKNGFAFGFDDLMYLTRSLRSNKPVIYIYHSHPDVGAYFSDEDKKHAVIDGIPVYPVKHIVVDVRSSFVKCSKIFDFVDGDYRLVEVLPGLVP